MNNEEQLLNIIRELEQRDPKPEQLLYLYKGILFNIRLAKQIAKEKS